MVVHFLWKCFAAHGEGDSVLCLSHWKRVALNRQMNQRRKPPGALFFRHNPTSGDLTGNQPQSMWLWQGITEEEVALIHGATLRREQICKCTRLAHCLCYASVQGLTLPGVEDTDAPLFCLRKLYVGVS